MLTGVMAGTDWVHPNEPSYHIYEINKPVSGSLHRLRHIVVERNDQFAIYVEDLGLAKEYPNSGFQESAFKTGGFQDGRAWSEYSVGEAVGIMEIYRERRWDVEDLPRLRDLVEGYEETNEIRGRPKNRKVFGT